MKAATFLLVLPLVVLAAPGRRSSLAARHGDDESEGMGVGLHRHAGEEHGDEGYPVGYAEVTEHGGYGWDGVSHQDGDADGDDDLHYDHYDHQSDSNHSSDHDTPAAHAHGNDHGPASALDGAHTHSHPQSPAHDRPHPWPKAPASARPPSHHSHNAHAAPQTYLNDNDIHYWHSFPVSYLAADFGLDAGSAIFGEEFEGSDTDAGIGMESGSGEKGWMVLHVVAMCVAYFGALPIALALRAANHAGHHLANIVFLAIALLGWVAGAVYKAGTPDRYTGESHSGLGNTLVLVSLGLSLLDSLGLLKRTAEWYRRTPPTGRTWLRFKQDIFHAAQAREDVYGIYALTSRESGYEPSYVPTYRNHQDGRDRSEVVFAIGDDLSDDGRDSHEHGNGLEHEHDRDRDHDARQHRLVAQNGRSRYSSGSTGSAGSSGSQRTLRDSPGTGSPPVGYPFAPAPSAHRGSMHKRPLEMGAYDDPVSLLPDGPGGRASHEYELEPEQRRGQVRLSNDEQVFEGEYAMATEKRITVQRFGEVCLTWIRRGQVVLAYVAVLSGITVYTGMCRASFLPSCLAHYIKGSIFFGYGVLTFARYLGAYADMGWSWNRAPLRTSTRTGARGGEGERKTGSAPSAEMVECAVIFTYGITNTWMERFGAKAGDPYTVKQVQHISIAIMFWFAGLGGMLLESKTIRRVLGSAVARRESKEPASYAFSFNPLPALVIAVTGLAMAAHHQTYLFQVQIHSLWGLLLAGGSLFRLLTYMFLYLRPPVDSTLPSRPPTEILTAFGWATGGIVFIMSSEEVTYAAMRAGYDDMMACLNVSVALTALVFCWEVVVLGVKGWAVGRVQGRSRDVEV